MLRPEQQLIELAHLVINTMDKGRRDDGKLIDNSRFKAGYDACVLAGGFRFPPPPDHRAQNALLKQQLTELDY